MAEMNFDKIKVNRTVKDMLTTLYDQDEVLELFIASERREAAEEAAEEAAKKLYVNHVPIEIIAKSLEVDVKTVESWVS